MQMHQTDSNFTHVLALKQSQQRMEMWSEVSYHDKYKWIKSLDFMR